MAQQMEMFLERIDDNIFIARDPTRDRPLPLLIETLNPALSIKKICESSMLETNLMDSSADLERISITSAVFLLS